MFKRFRWVFLAMLAGGAILWLMTAGDGQKNESAEAQPTENKSRESSRHRTGEVEKNLPTPLEKKVAEQERKVEELKKVVIALGKAKAPIYLSPDGAPPPKESREESTKKAKAAQDFEDAKQEFFADRQLLQKLKLELAEEQQTAQPGAD